MFLIINALSNDKERNAVVDKNARSNFLFDATKNVCDAVRANIENMTQPLSFIHIMSRVYFFLSI